MLASTQLCPSHRPLHLGRRACRQSRLIVQAASTDNQSAGLPSEASVLSSFRVVLVAPKTPVNIGAVARCCGNFECPNLWVVSPRCDPRSEEANMVACSDTIMRSLVTVGSLEEALADTASSVGFTRRAGATRLVHASIGHLLAAQPSALPLQPPSTEQKTDRQASPAAGITALVFGREESGLTEAELRMCRHACAIPTGRQQPSMNLSHATSVVLADLFQRSLALGGEPDDESYATSMPQTNNYRAAVGIVGSQQQGGPSSGPAAAAELESLLKRVGSIAEAVGITSLESTGGGSKGTHGRRMKPLGHMRNLLSRAQPTQGEVRSLHGLASAVSAALQASPMVQDTAEHHNTGAAQGTDAAEGQDQ